MQNPNENNLPIIQQNNLQVVDNQLTITDLLLAESEDNELREWWNGLLEYGYLKEQGLENYTWQDIFWVHLELYNNNNVEIANYTNNHFDDDDGNYDNNCFENYKEKFGKDYKNNNRVISSKELKKIGGFEELLLTCLGLETLDPLSNICDNIKYLGCSLNYIMNIDMISSFSNLEYLNLSHIDRCHYRRTIKNFDSLSKLTKIKALDISHNSRMYGDKFSMDYLSSLTNLESLNITYTHFIDFDFIKKLSSLKIFKFGCHSNDYSYTLKDIEHLIYLEELKFEGGNINELETIKNFKYLKKLSFCSTKITTLKSLSENKSIEELDIEDGEHPFINSLKGLESMIQLKSLKFHYTVITSLEPILDLPNLEYLNCKYNSIPPSEIEKFKALHPDCKVYHD